jgi:hypothetical protein
LLFATVFAILVFVDVFTFAPIIAGATANCAVIAIVCGVAFALELLFESELLFEFELLFELLLLSAEPPSVLAS